MIEQAVQNQKFNNDVDHNALTEAWLKNKLSLDKGLFTLSGAALAIVVCFMTVVSPPSILVLVLYIVSAFCFLLSLSLSIYVYKGNSAFIERLKENVEATDELLPVLDKATLITFLFGVVLMVFVGIFSSCQNIQHEIKPSVAVTSTY